MKETHWFHVVGSFFEKWQHRLKNMPKRCFGVALYVVVVGLFATFYFATLAGIASEESANKKLTSHLRITADKKMRDKKAKTFVANGHVIVKLTGQDSSLEADRVSYNENTYVMEAIGNVRVFRGTDLSTGSHFKFYIYSTDWLIMNPETILYDLRNHRISASQDRKYRPAQSNHSSKDAAQSRQWYEGKDSLLYGKLNGHSDVEGGIEK